VTASGFIVSLLYRVSGLKSLPLGIGVAIGIIMIMIIYLTSLFLLESITGEDIRWFKNCFKNTGKVQDSFES